MATVAWISATFGKSKENILSAGISSESGAPSRTAAEIGLESDQLTNRLTSGTTYMGGVDASI
jgi:hypothetical protein